MLLHLMPKPTIAMVGGPAIGAGCSLAAACDLRFASEDAVFAANFSPNGLSGDYGGSFFWTRIGGTALARRLYLLNEKLPAPRALELGMVHAVLPPEALRPYTYEIAASLVRTPATLLALMKENLNEAEDEVERRRWLFANEAENQGRAARAMYERMQQTTEPGRGGRQGPDGHDRAPDPVPAVGRFSVARVRGCGRRGQVRRCAGVQRPRRGLQGSAPDGDRGGDRAQQADGDGPSGMRPHGSSLDTNMWRRPEEPKKIRRNHMKADRACVPTCRSR